MGTPREVVGHLGNHGLAHAWRPLKKTAFAILEAFYTAQASERKLSCLPWVERGSCVRIICLPVNGGLPPDPISTTSNDQTSRQDYVNLTINCICVFVVVSVYLASGFDDEICSQGLCQVGHQQYLCICLLFVYFLYLSFCLCTFQHRWPPALMVMPLSQMFMNCF